MDNKELHDEKSLLFYEQGTSCFPKTESKASADDQLIRGSTFGLLSGGLGYLVPPEIFNIVRTGSADEIATTLAMVSGFLFGSLSSAESLCNESQEAIDTRKLDYAKVIGGGAAHGGFWAALTKASLFSFVDCGIIAGSLAVALTYAYYRNRSIKPKYCKKCEKKGNCSQRICRFCGRIFFPKKVTLKCDSRHLGWYEIASFFDQQEMNIIETMKLTSKYINEWGPITTTNGQIKVNCKKFFNWIDNNEDVLPHYMGKVKGIESDRYAIQYLDKLDKEQVDA